MSDTNASYQADEPFFQALLTPHRSLGRTGFFILMAALLFGWAVTGAIFLAHGAWPVFGFFGLDVIGVYVAFRLNYRAARAREEISVSRTSLDIRKTAPSGRSEAHHFNPFWTRFSIARHTEIGITRMAVEAQGKSVSIGGFLNPDDRESFASAFSRALATAKAR
ncbi:MULTISPECIES: DUF2244 domain-containing protein [unclassified Mesorhizobium]|uniref:DUF2244 domain-containing protein n=1 Tax=unclassified Mesorhizobium TaxID=325217 RepID=UPI000BAE8AF3|nr:MULTISPECIES: DUF2244 domain-containing protein [unclassified Mesorhizobium]TGT63414.1 DUF2244 domain-containing protein [Mesorhizobium sp. M00.F.Ca.ET.170.01.1.1]AZO11496.1 DUF2244 domain-containing protein [Mesorhizobium sp. M3A.F.Ca.ET.080.04.2.1]PBB88240.1 hypothetical protein CK216_00355 [Mesorhizobium sp. WSM3876]RWB92003.1 MAG: DUF2244 domain-containing protein [Mesorhizobium sp.]RWE25566.1 MAG: DUF2244 domain-containing protein [Mesorhizobium sp.]